MSLTNLENLKLGRSLRKSNKLIECTAVIEYSSGSPSQDRDAVIPPSGINTEGYVIKVWLDVRTEKEEVDGDTYLIIDPWCHTPTSGLAKSWIDRFELSDYQPHLLSSPDIEVYYRIISNAF